jgi:hypothetical protein
MWCCVGEVEVDKLKLEKIQLDELKTYDITWGNFYTPNSLHPQHPQEKAIQGLIHLHSPEPLSFENHKFIEDSVGSRFSNCYIGDICKIDNIPTY